MRNFGLLLCEFVKINIVYCVCKPKKKKKKESHSMKSAVYFCAVP
jgi:hypothetical protein